MSGDHPSEEAGGDSRSRKTPLSGLSQMRDRKKFGKNKRFSPNEIDEGELEEPEEDEEIQDLSGTTSYYTS